jgi:hypothetical protein
MMIAITPSLNASSRVLLMPLLRRLWGRGCRDARAGVTIQRQSAPGILPMRVG